MKLRWLLLAAISTCAYGQAVRYDSNVTQPATNVPPGAAAAVYTVPSAIVTICGYPATPSSGSPCTNKVNIYEDQGTTTLLPNPVPADQVGRFGFWILPNQYSYSVQTQSGKYVGTFALSLTSPAGPAIPFLGIWSSSTTYLLGQSVSYNNQLYISLQNGNLNHQPDISTSFWSPQLTTGVVSTSPSSSQSVMQPPGSTLNINSLNGTAALPLAGIDPTGGTDNSSTINTYIAANPKGLIIPPGKFWVPSYSNIYGAPINGNGVLLGTISQIATDGGGNVVTANRAQINSYSDANQYIIGREHLTHFERSLAFSGANNYFESKVIFSGDSTTAGVNITDPQFLVNNMFGQVALDRGFLGVSCINAGHSGDNSSNWLNTWLAQDMAQNPDVYVMRWGINDGGTGITPQQTIANMRAGLAQIRATKGDVDQITLVLMMPSSTNDGPNGRDQAFYEQLRNGFVQAARDYQAVFIDTYAWLRDSNSAVSSMDAPYVGVGVSNPIIHVHPDNYRNALINSITVDALLPSGYQQWATNNFINVPSAQAILAGNELPSTFRKGVSIFRAKGPATSGTFPYDGYVNTEISAEYNNIGARQFNWSYQGSGVTKFAVRISNGNAWLPWKYFDDDVVAVGSGTDPKPANSTYMDYAASHGRIVGVGNNTTTPAGVQLLGASSDQSVVDTYLSCEDSNSCTIPQLAGYGKALVCVDPSGKLYRGTTTTCP